MDINTAIREIQLENLHQLIEGSKDDLNSILSEIGWTSEGLLDATNTENSMVSCMYDESHRVPKKSIEKHQRMCCFKRLGYTDEDMLLSEPGSEGGKSSIIIENDKKRRLFRKLQNAETSSNWMRDPAPQSSDRLLCAYTSEERLILYDYAASHTKGPEPLPEFILDQYELKNEKQMTHEQILEAERNARRRRVKYKSVHTSHKNHTEVIREVINNQMTLLCDHHFLAGPKNKRDASVKVEDNGTVVEREQRSSSSSSRHKRRHRSRDRHSSSSSSTRARKDKEESKKRSRNNDLRESSTRLDDQRGLKERSKGRRYSKEK